MNNGTEIQMWDNAAFDNGGESEDSTARPPPLLINLCESFDSDSTKENHSVPPMGSSSSLVSSTPLQPINTNHTIKNTNLHSNSKPILKQRNGVLLEFEEEENPERDFDFEIEEIERVIQRLSLKLEGLKIEKEKKNAKETEKRGVKLWDEGRRTSRIEDLSSTSAKVKTPRRGLSMLPSEIAGRERRRGISLGPAEIFSASKSRQMGKQQDISITPGHPISNRRKSCFWKLQDVDELRATKERGKSMSLSPKSRAKGVSKMEQNKQFATTIGSKNLKKKEMVVGSSIKPKNLFKDGEKSAPEKRPVKSGRVVPSRYNQIGIGNSAAKEMRKRSLPENDKEDANRNDKRSVCLAGKSQGKEEKKAENRVKKRWETPSSLGKMLDVVPKIRTVCCNTDSPRDSGPAKKVSELVGRKTFFTVEEEEEESDVCKTLSFEANEEDNDVERCALKIRTLHCLDKSPRDSGAAKRVSDLVERKSFFNGDDDIPVFSFELEDDKD